MERTIRRSHALGLRSVALILVGLGVAAACSDDSDSPGSAQPPGGGGEGGEAPSNTGGSTSGSGGSGAGKAGTETGGSQNMSGAPAQGGEAGMPMVVPPTVGEQCTSCGNTKCEAELTSCGDSTQCSAWLACLTACDTTACVDGCDAKYADAARVYTGVYDCLCTSCKDDCSGAGACGKKTCVDDDPLPLMPTAPANLAETGLYELAADGAAGASGAGGAGSVDLAMPIITDAIKMPSAMF